MNVDLDNAWAALAYPRPREMWQYAHNADVSGDPDLPHAPLMSLLGLIGDYAADREPFVVEHVLPPLIQAAHKALNLPRGNLDGGRLSEWLDSVSEALGIPID